MSLLLYCQFRIQHFGSSVATKIGLLNFNNAWGQQIVRAITALQLHMGEREQGLKIASARFVALNTNARSEFHFTFIKLGLKLLKLGAMTRK